MKKLVQAVKGRALSRALVSVVLIAGMTVCLLPFSARAAGNQDSAYQLFRNRLSSVATNIFPLGTPVAFRDVCGDVTAEMFYLTTNTVKENGDDRETSQLHVLSFRSGMLSEVLNQGFNFGRNEEMGNCLTVWGAPNTIAICDSYATEDIWGEDFTVYEFDGTRFGKTEEFSVFADPFHVSGKSGGNADGIHYLHGADQREVSEASFKSYYEKVQSLGNPIIQISVVDYGLENSPYGMNYADAVSYLENKAGKIEQSVSGFYDVQNSDWFANDVRYAVDKRLMNGTAEHYFTPGGTTTRAQAVTILYRLAGSPYVAGDNSFVDVKSDTWYANAVQWAVKNGVASGYGNGRFGPNDSLNREQLATMLYRYAQFKKFDVTDRGDISRFYDSGSVSGYAIDAMSWAVKKGLISGTSDGKLTPGSTATRAQLAAILHRFCENVR